MVNAVPSTVEISYPVTDPSSLVEPSSRSLVEHCLLMEATPVATQTDHIKKISFTNYLQKPQSRFTQADHLNDNFYIPTKPFIEHSLQVYIEKFGITPDRQYCL